MIPHITAKVHLHYWKPFTLLLKYPDITEYPQHYCKSLPTQLNTLNISAHTSPSVEMEIKLTRYFASCWNSPLKTQNFFFSHQVQVFWGCSERCLQYCLVRGLLVARQVDFQSVQPSLLPLVDAHALLLELTDCRDKNTEPISWKYLYKSSMLGEDIGRTSSRRDD